MSYKNKYIYKNITDSFFKQKKNMSFNAFTNYRDAQ